jgi:DNA-binding GntR family transcriptional regulator
MDAEAIAKAAPRQVLADHAYDVLVELLVDGRLEAGSAINIDGLARSMEISRTPIREALARLEATSLIRRTALKGYRVAPLPSTEELLELMDARLVIEPVNASLACARNNESLVTQLQDSVDTMAKAPRGAVFAEFREYLQADERFHFLISSGAGNRYLLSAYTALGGQAQRFRLFAGRGVTDAAQAIDEHSQIVRAFAEGDPAGAQAAMTRHLERARARTVEESLSTS